MAILQTAYSSSLPGTFVNVSKIEQTASCAFIKLCLR
jgi:hypothetical protein